MSQTEVNEFLSSYASDVRDLAMRTRALVKDLVPDAIESVHTGWKNIGYATGSGKQDQFCYITPQKSDVRLGFNEGAELSDPGAHLQGTGKKMRHVKLRSGDELENPDLHRLVAEAAVRSRAS